MLDVMRKVWTGDVVAHDGDHFKFPALAQKPAPTKPIPIIIGGASKAALKRAATRGDGWVGAGNTPDEAAEILQTLNDLRKQAGRENEPAENIVPLTTPPNPDDYKRLFELGAHGTVNYPFKYTVGPDATLQQKLDMMKQFGDNVIGPMGDC
jgi:alkanesulfonate monooxygenase SsuD/methylene tetrahydromethanopterin reductase-like flavin-dependent oxidoreductase (luciferase family)